MIAESISGRFTSLVSTRISFLVTSIFVSGCDPNTNFPTSSSGVIIDPFGLPLPFGSFSQDASQASSDPTIHGLERIQFGVLEVVKPPPQYRIDSRNDARQTLAVGSAGSFA